MVFWSCLYNFGFTRSKRTNIAAPYLKGSVLDIGCGNAVLRSKLNGNCSGYVGIDINNSASDMKVDIENIIDRNKIAGKFDSIAMLAVIEHLHEPKQVLNWCYKELNKQGIIVITTPTLLGNMILKLFSIDAGHTSIFNKKELEQILSDTGFNTLYYSTFELKANQIIVGRKE